MNAASVCVGGASRVQQCDHVVQMVVMVTSCEQLLPHQQLQPGYIVELVSPETASALQHTNTCPYDQ